jgi:hypothetical protein
MADLRVMRSSATFLDLSPDPIEAAARRLHDWLLERRDPESARASLHGPCSRPGCTATIDTELAIWTDSFSCPKCGLSFRI